MPAIPKQLLTAMRTVRVGAIAHRALLIAALRDPSLAAIAAGLLTSARRWRGDIYPMLTCAMVCAAAGLGATAMAQTESPAPADQAAKPAEPWAVHGQFTFVDQGDLAFRAPYSGPNSLAPNQSRETADLTLYAGVRLWPGAEVWINPEIDQGFGLSDTLGVAGFPSGEAYKVGRAAPYFRLQRLFIRETIDLGGEQQAVDADLNQLAGSQSANRLVITAGKLGVPDIFDTNTYAHDPRGDFLNWALIDTGTFDYAADAWGYSYGVAAEWYVSRWTLRAGVFNLSNVPNSETLETNFSQFQLDGEVEERHTLRGHPGKIKITGFLSRGRMGSFDDAVRLAQATGQPADIAAVRRYQNRGGVSWNVEQEVADGVGVFVRAGVADGSVEPYEFADIDRTFVTGVSLNGKPWGRPHDTIGLAGVVNGISRAHELFLAAGGTGILVGDGQLPHPGAEGIVETYYDLAGYGPAHVSLDYQFVGNPAYNRDRGPVSIFAARLHAHF
jgi:high affinity Mn2+ porin